MISQYILQQSYSNNIPWVPSLTKSKEFAVKIMYDKSYLYIFIVDLKLEANNVYWQ